MVSLEHLPRLERLATAPLGGLVRRTLHENVPSPVVVPLDLGGCEMVANSLVLPYSTNSGTTFRLKACLYRLVNGGPGPAPAPVQQGSTRIVEKINGTEAERGGTSVLTTGHLIKVFEQPVRMTPQSQYYVGLSFTVSAGALNFYISDTSGGTWLDLDLPIGRTWNLDNGGAGDLVLPQTGALSARNGRVDFPPLAVVYSRRGAYLLGSPFLHP